MLFEFRGKIYEVPSFFLYFLAFLLFFGLGFLTYKGILLVSNASFFAFPGSLSSFQQEKKPLSPQETTSLNDPVTQGQSSPQPLPKEVKQLLEQKPQQVLNPYEICHFNGRGRVAKKIGNKFDCRKTEDLKIITLQNMKVYCCVAP